MNSAALERYALGIELRRAVDQGQFVLHYQPVMGIVSGQIEGLEALLRWRSSSRGLVGPDKFIPLLEETGMILEVSRWVFRTACRQATAWNKQGTPLRIAVNLSPLDFLQIDLAGSLISIMQEEQTPAHLIELEITENSLLDSGAQVQKTLQQLKAAGLLLFLDDFGTGYSSLLRLKSLPFTKLKIDRSFIRELPDNPDDSAITLSVLGLARGLNLAVVAEGVENIEQEQWLQQQGCHYLQGFKYYQPMAVADFFAVLAIKKAITE